MKALTNRNLASLSFLPGFLPSKLPVSSYLTYVRLEIPEDKDSYYQESFMQLKKQRHKCCKHNKEKRRVSSTKQFTRQVRKTKNCVTNTIWLKNLWIISYNLSERCQNWNHYLKSLSELIHQLKIQLQVDSDPQLTIILKKLTRSYCDSFQAFFYFVENSLSMITLAPPQHPLPLPVIEALSDDSDKIARKQTFKHRSKKFKNAKKQARVLKMAERDFWANQWIEDFDEEENVNPDFSDYENAVANLSKAEQALKSPCIVEAAWAIHDGLEDEYAGIIFEANEIFENYKAALEQYESFYQY